MSKSTATIPSPSAAPATELDRLSPDQLMRGFTAGSLLRFVLLAVAIHAVILGATSTTYLYERYLEHFDAEAYKVYVAKQEEMKKAKKAAELAAQQPPASSATPVEQAAVSPEAPAEGAAAAPAEGANNAAANALLEGVPEDKRNNPVVQKLVEPAKPEEIPKKPSDDLGLSIDDTNVK